MGLQRGARIWLCRTLAQAERRCTLTHELVHRERGPVPTDPAAAAREEQIVDEITARRLITLSQLAEGLRWFQGAARACRAPVGRPAHPADQHGHARPARSSRPGYTTSTGTGYGSLDRSAVCDLVLEREWFATAGAKEDAIRELGLSPVRYYQKLNQLITTEAAVAYDPVTANRLRRRANL